MQIEQHKVNGEQQKLARIHVHVETSKVRTSRTFLCRNGQYFERFNDISQPKIADKLIFTIDNENELRKRTLLYHWHKMIELLDIADRGARLSTLQLASLYDYAAHHEWFDVKADCRYVWH